MLILFYFFIYFFKFIQGQFNYLINLQFIKSLVKITIQSFIIVNYLILILKKIMKI